MVKLTGLFIWLFPYFDHVDLELTREIQYHVSLFRIRVDFHYRIKFTCVHENGRNV